MSISRHTYTSREVGFFVEAALSPLSVTSVEWSDNGGVVEIYTTPDPLHTLRDINNWTKFSKPGSSGSFDVPADTRKIAIAATSHDANDPSLVTVVSDGLTNMELARLYGVDQLDIPALLPPDIDNLLYWFDVNDISTLWKDQAGTMPITTDLDVINRIDNKGSDTTNIPYLHDRLLGGNAPPIYYATEFGGKAAMGVKTGGSAWTMQVQIPPPNPPSGPVEGLTIAAVGRQNDVAFGSFTTCSWGGVAVVDNDGDGNSSAGNWLAKSSGGGASHDSGEASPVGVWNYCYSAQDDGTDVRVRAGGGSELTIVGSSYAPVGFNQNMVMTGFRSQWVEWLIWAGQLSASSRSGLTSYFDTKFGVLPF